MNPTDRPSGQRAQAASPNSAHHSLAPHATTRGRFIVDCPSCGGNGLVFRDGSQVQLACRLCWQRGVVARIVAERYLRSNEPVPRAVQP